MLVVVCDLECCDVVVRWIKTSFFDEVVGRVVLAGIVENSVDCVYVVVGISSYIVEIECIVGNF